MRKQLGISAILALAAAACGASPDGSSAEEELGTASAAGTTPTATIKVVKTTTGQAVFQQTNPAPGTYAYGHSELGSTLAANNLGLKSTLVKLQTESPLQELLVFARDPAEHAATIDHLMTDEYAQGTLALYPINWRFQQAKWAGTTGSAVALPFAVSLVVPFWKCFAGFCEDANLNQGQFWTFWGDDSTHLGVPSPLVPGLSSPGGQGSVKALLLYDHGMCSQEVPLETLVAGKLDDIWAKLKVEINDNWDIDYGTRLFQGITSYVSHSAGSLHDIHGGLIVSSQFFISTYFGSNVSIDFSTKYQFKLTAGIVDVAPTVWLHVSGSDDTFNQFADQLGNKAPAQIHAEAKTRQAAPVPAQTLGAAKIKLLLGIGAAKSALNLSDADVSALSAHVTKSANWSNVDSNGNCKMDAGQQACKFAVPAKRLNVYPNSLELVFFDGKDTSSPSYALYAALYGSDLTQGTHLMSKLCQSSDNANGAPQSANRDWTRRKYFTDVRAAQTFDP